MPVPTVKTRFSSRNKANVAPTAPRRGADPRRGVSTTASGGLPRPTLLGASTLVPPADEALFPARPRRLWKVSDTRLSPLPPGYPPVDPRCCVFVADAPPSVVAVRIAEALRRLSVAVEYDEETPSATCWTSDRCHFVVQLWQGPKTTGQVQSQSRVPDLSAGILVEAMRQAGSVISFHRMVRTILAAAISHETGDDCRRWYQSSPLEFPRWNSDDGRSVVSTLGAPDEGGSDDASQPLAVAVEGLEQAGHLLGKDRHDAQTLGMERLVHLTDEHTVGVAVACIAAQSLLGVPPTEDVPASLKALHQDWMMDLLIHRRLPSEKEPGQEGDTESPVPRGRFCTPRPNQAAVDLETTTDTDGDDESARVEALLKQMWDERAETGDENHAGRLRGLLMRVWANGLAVLHAHNHVVLTTLLQQHKALVSANVLDILLEDAAGCGRPPMAAVMGTRLATPHEALWALVSLRILSQHSGAVRRHLEASNYAAVLEKASHVGASLHAVLEREAQLALQVWREKS